ncbi:MAG: hypothetical protein A3G51_00735 [Candidatus Yanofskybacteria bacterium RIFCSPLOWO2_12_FULL_43_11b]|uniref:Glycosyltransferase 2-like domain-containing protein n=1 Tax=Candidatus Yanofskybacteria bacterium RIFCSPLOWO2_12_FULL_43_11b TaxID=1802710 RepID=A0A1F8HAU3_9BACT|nr:MAG: hypothetical protein A2742_03975 [Candidatus Yanofskybacteria bacterium RIFCSPHIGHO2_01_FULL_43_32]OGN10567.1 MAG: hypothetical protein A3C69_02355 [Candidatus Yanofskybacteria bacterium RIFCSPHIGHO2_02_FULL_43_12]OGN17768.1 MAG: hypothetical protein A3E34_01315 [Candidatus Yanofskybacteria bacterium RIFCSPHIGHO2_12_FULL_43_11]OGN24512.1 MAG: hypothetical protein A2923_00955 [Candidatus Yanofskybacteria bacterium RIFCSPLOWO2_01_FULL_43_46]OGN34098.1 MAG: hypothetical protein A3G51_00735
MKISSLDRKIYQNYKEARAKLTLKTGDIFTKYLAIQPKKHLELLKNIGGQIPQINPHKTIFVLIPAFYEANFILQTLEALLPKNSDALRFWNNNVVVIILNNYCLRKPDTETPQLVRQFKQKKQFQDIFVINYSFPNKRSNVGYCRKILHDLVILKAEDSDINLADSIFVSFDADILEVDLRIFSKAYKVMRGNAKIDAIQGKMTRLPKGIYRNNLFYIFSAIYDEVRNEWQSRKYRNSGVPKYNFMWNRIFTYGTGLFLRPSVYCEIGGFDGLSLGEDYAIGSKISFLRATGPDSFKNSNVNTVRALNYITVNHPRRDLYAFINGAAVYNKFGLYSHDQKIRKTGIEWGDTYKKIKREMPLNNSNLLVILRTLLDKSAKRISDPTENMAILNRAIQKVKNNSKKLPTRTIYRLDSALEKLNHKR